MDSKSVAAKGQLKSVNGVMQSQVTNRPVPKSLLRHVKWESLLAGISGGVVSTMILHPLDLVKIRFQVNEGSCGVAAIQRPKYHGMFHALRSIFNSGGIPGIYKGVTPNVWGTGASWGLYFFFYNSIKTWYQNGDSTVALGFTGHMAASAEAGLLTLILTNPIWVTKTRLCLQYEREPLAQTKGVYYKGMADALTKIYQMEGVRGLYKGFVPGVIGISHGMIQFTVYEELKNWYNQRDGKSVDTRLTTSEYLMFAAVSKVIAATATYPYQVVRSRLQDQHSTYSGVIDVVTKMVKYEGVASMYKGMTVYLVHVMPNICIVFLIYEYVSNWRTWNR